jgi:hypothetical protein
VVVLQLLQDLYFPADQKNMDLAFEELKQDLELKEIDFATAYVIT